MSAGRLVSRNASAKSWREKLAVVEELMVDESLELSDAVLADVAVYLRFLSTGEIPCVEDGRHFRPSHHARMAAQIHERLRKLSSPSPEPEPNLAKEGGPDSNALASDAPLLGGTGGGLPHKSACTMTGSAFLIRKIISCLPSTAAPFQRAEPLTRIRDIAHRNDIPHDLKREIKTTLQNKLHRCAGPEDLVTSRRLLERITAPEAHYAPDFVEHFKNFHGELTEFFNARSLEERLHALAPSVDEDARNLINEFLAAKQQQTTSAQSLALASLTQLRMRLIEAAADKTGAGHQELWLADIALEDYAFVLLSELVNRLGTPHPASGHLFHEPPRFVVPALAGPSNDPRRSSNRLKPGLQTDWRSGSGVQCANFGWGNSLPIGWGGGQGEGKAGGTDVLPALDLLAFALTNLRLSQVSSEEVVAIQNELARARVELESGPRDSMLRLKAAIERARRLAGEFSDGVLVQLAGRAATLGQALGVAPHAIRVLAEGEVRGHLVFQLAKLTSDLLRQLRAALGQSPWDVIVPGQTTGRLVAADALDAMAASDGPTIVVLVRAEGDEEVPSSVRGILLAHELPHLSHLGVRARQAGVVVACCAEASSIAAIRSRAGQRVSLIARAEGIELTAASAENAAVPFARCADRPVAKVKLQSKPIILPVEKCSPATGGNKSEGARRLLELAQNQAAGFSAPTGMVIPFGVMESCLGANAKTLQQYETMTARMNSAGAEEVPVIAAQLRELIQGLVMQGEIVAAVLRAFGPSQRLAVRSSANTEDLAHMAGAGLHESVVGVAPDSLDRAVKMVWASLWTERAAASRRQAGVAHAAAHMAVLIQPVVEPGLSFILHTVNPQNNNPGECYVELAVGLGETLASGATRGTPYRMVCDRGTGQVTMLAFANFSHAREVAADGRLVERRLDYSCVPFTMDAAVRANIGAKVAKIANFVEAEMGAPQDVEGVLQGDEIILVQSRVQQGIPAKP